MSDLVLFFDIDGTMLHTGGAGRKAMELALREEFRIPEPFEAVHTAGRTDRGIENEVFARCGIPLTLGERQRFMRAYLDRLPQCLRELLGGLLPGVRPLLEELSRNPRVHLSLLTGNYAEGAWMKLRHFQIAEFFSGGAYRDHHPERDDVARDALTHVQSALQKQIPGNAIWVIGDTPSDIRCARAIGAKAAAVATGIYAADELHPHSPDELFENFADTAQVVSRLLAELQHT
ncbi:MAG UNVERIFIED_CONTAM: haloacid dehalogenase-like hydrolase [Planctomycetaceae bacterium]|jgi:phosphoglycolate phosphatase